MQPTKADGLWGFFGLTLGLMAATFGVMAVFQIPGPSLAGSESTALGSILFFIGGFSPTIAAVIMAQIVAGREGRRDLWRRGLQFGIGLRWYLIIIGITLVAQFAQVPFGGELTTPWWVEMPGAFLLNLPFTLLLGPVSEEYGWRGFAQDRVLKRWNLPIANLVLGVIWALWHLPLFFVPGTSQQALGNQLISFPLFSVQVVALTVLYTWVYQNTERSIWGAIFFHFMTAMAALLATSFVADGGSFVHPVSVGVISLIAVAVLIGQMRQSP